MKYLPLLTLLLLVACSTSSPTAVPVNSTTHFNKVIGSVERGTARVTADKSKMAANWHRVANEPKLGFESFRIMQENGAYYLLGVDEDMGAAGRVELVLVGKRLYEQKEAESGRAMLCIGCVGEGCLPKVGETGGTYCSDCTDGDCAKSSTMTDGPILGE